ncbi:MAG TPA: M20/M25/M40 family metallo-hydrolase [Pyrinomonadaceae bacterium]|nr:M20/M25/M40 family metallo-hydrolase [Pyrinomonadaceae bacterium]
MNDSINRRSRTQQHLALLLAILFVTSTTFGLPQSAPAPARALSATEQQLLDSISVATIKETVNALAADDMQGRGTAQPGGDKAAAYLADRFAKLGLKPLGDKNSYLQPIKFRETQFLQTTFTAGSETLKAGTDFFVSPPYSGDENIKADLVFVAYGLAAPFVKRNDLNGIDVRGKIVLLRDGPPPEINKDQWKKAHAQAVVMRTLIGRGAAAIIIVGQNTETLTFPEIADYLTRRQVEPASETEMPDFLPPFLSVSDAAADKLFAASGVTKAEAFAKSQRDDFTPIDLKQQGTITIKLKKTTGTSNNVVGLLEGSDPKLKSEALVYSAHYDAYGLSSDNRIYHGAADNALGVAEMLSIAEVLTRAESKPRRSIIFLAVTGEEYGGYGSDYWVKNPTWKIKEVAADLNLDGMGTEVYGPVKALVGYGAEHSTLGNLMNEVAAATGLRVIPDPMPEEKSFYRSDHYFFVKKGVPGIMILGAPDGTTESWTDRLRKWEKTDYHQPTDIVRPDWDWSGPRTVAGVMLLMGVRAANAESMPEWLPSSIFNRERGTDKPAPPEP